MHKKDAKHVKGVVGDILKGLERKSGEKGNPVINAWNKVVDEKTQIHSRPVNFKNGTIVVLVENSVWLYKLTLEKNKILEKFNEEYTGRKKALDIRFRVGTMEDN